MYITGCRFGSLVLLVRITKAKYQKESSRESLRKRIERCSGRRVKFIVYESNRVLPISEYFCQNIQWDRINLRQ